MANVENHIAVSSFCYCLTVKEKLENGNILCKCFVTFISKQGEQSEILDVVFEKLGYQQKIKLDPDFRANIIIPDTNHLDFIIDFGNITFDHNSSRLTIKSNSSKMGNYQVFLQEAY